MTNFEEEHKAHRVLVLWVSSRVCPHSWYSTSQRLWLLGRKLLSSWWFLHLILHPYHIRHEKQNITKDDKYTLNKWYLDKNNLYKWSLDKNIGYMYPTRSIGFCPNQVERRTHHYQSWMCLTEFQRKILKLKCMLLAKSSSKHNSRS